MVYLADVYAGAGLKGVPRGTVKTLRLFTYHFAYHGMGGLLGVVGIDGPWDVKRVLGTVPVDADGSAKFRVPANTPISVQPLDAEGKALQLMRSWLTAMPGEVGPCVGCHEPQNTAPPPQADAGPEPAAGRDPALARPGARLQLRPRGAAGARQVLRRLPQRPAAARRRRRSPTCAATEKITDWTVGHAGQRRRRTRGKFSVGYAALHRFVRRPGIESDYHLLAPLEFHADTTRAGADAPQGPLRRASSTPRRGTG